MDIRKNAPIPEFYRIAIDSASQSNCDSPADLICRPSSERPGNLPKLRRYTLSSSDGCTTLPKSTDEDRASIKRFNFLTYYTATGHLSITFPFYFNNLSKNIKKHYGCSKIYVVILQVISFSARYRSGWECKYGFHIPRLRSFPPDRYRFWTPGHSRQTSRHPWSE